MVERGRATAVEAAVDEDYLRRVVTRLTSIGSSPLGFRAAGTPEDAEAAAYVADELRTIGLDDVTLEPVTVDAWRFRGASLELRGSAFECASFAGAPPTRDGGIEAEVVDGGRGTRGDLEGRDVRGKIVLADWRGDQLLWPSLLAAQAAAAGAAALVCTCGEGGRYFQGEGALGSFDGLWLPDGVPLATIRKEDAVRLRGLLDGGRARARLTVDAEVERDATGWNVLGTLPGRGEGPPILVAGHHDAWFSGAIDDATGVAATLAIAKAMREAGHVPARPILFGSHTAEEYGLADSPFDWLIGAWWQLTREHPEWRETLAFYLNVEGTGFPLPIQVDAPPELRRFCRRTCAAARADGLLPYGVVYGVPRSATELWPLVASGVPGISVQSAVTTYATHEYHTQLDNLELVDFTNLAVMTRLFARFAVVADRAPDELLEPRARSADIRGRGRVGAAAKLGLDMRPVEAALARFEKAAAVALPGAPRAAFAIIAPALEALNGRDKQSLLHLQALVDVEALDSALAALERGDVRASARAVARCGRNELARHLDRDVFHRDRARHRRDHPRLAWGALANLTQSPDLWDELASLRFEPGAPSPNWVAASLRAKREEAAGELERRLGRTAEALEAAASALVGAGSG